MAELEDDLKLNNWLSILTFDAFKYRAAGGAMIVRWTDEGMTLVFPGVTNGSDGLNRKFRRMVEQEGQGEDKAVQP